MKIQSYKNIGRVTILLLVLLSFFSCGGAEKSVKNGRIQLDESITLGDAFDNYEYFSKTKWDSFKDDQNRQIVQVTGIIDVKSMFIADYNGQTINMLEGQYFEQGLLDMLLNQTVIFQNEGTDIVSQGNPQELVELISTRRDSRDDRVAEIVNYYDENPEAYQKEAAKQKNFFEVNDFGARYDALIPVLDYYANGNPERGYAAYNEIAGYLSTDVNGTEAEYTVQFSVNGKEFNYYAGVFSITIDVEGASGPVTFNVPESTNTLPYLIAVYNNARFME